MICLSHALIRTFLLLAICVADKGVSLASKGFGTNCIADRASKQPGCEAR